MVYITRGFTVLLSFAVVSSNASAFFPFSRLAPAITSLAQAEPFGAAHFTGQIQGIEGATIRLKIRSGQIIYVDISTAVNRWLSVVPVVGEFVQVDGAMTAPSMLSAELVRRVKSDASGWISDSR